MCAWYTGIYIPNLVSLAHMIAELLAFIQTVTYTVYIDSTVHADQEDISFMGYDTPPFAYNIHFHKVSIPLLDLLKGINRV